MFAIDLIQRLVAGYRRRLRQSATRDLIASLPQDIRKDIGWPAHGSRDLREDAVSRWPGGGWA